MPTSDAPTRVQTIIDRRTYELASRKSQKDIAREAGYSNPNMISILKNGVAKLPLDRVFPLANALEVDPVVLMRAALEQHYTDETLDLIRKILSNTLTTNEKQILDYIHSKAGDADPHLSDKLKKAIDSALE